MKPGPKEAALKALRSKNAAVFQQPAAGNAGLRTVPAVRAVDGNARDRWTGNGSTTPASQLGPTDSDPAVQGVPVKNVDSSCARTKFDRVTYQREYMRKR